MKIIQYRLCTLVHEEENTREVFYQVEMPWSEQNERVARGEAYRGEYIIIDEENI